MPVAFGGIALHAHHGDRISQIEKTVHVSLKVGLDDAFVVPIPYRFSRPSVDRPSTYLPRNAPLATMQVVNSGALKPALKIQFAKLRPIHAYGAVPDVEHASNARLQQAIEYIVGGSTLVPERKKVGSIYGSRCVPAHLAFFAKPL
jgi:hypothetical protein